MPESDKHKELKEKLCGCEGTETEVSLPNKQRLDCDNPLLQSCGEVEFTKRGIAYSIKKLEDAQELGCKKPLLIVREKDYEYAKGLAKGTRIKVFSESGKKLQRKIKKCKVSSLSRD